jgi:uncharacterized membrane protein
MSTSASERSLEERVERLEQELGAVIARLGGVRVAVPPRPRQDHPPPPERIRAEQRQGSRDARPASSGSRNPGPITSGSPDPAPVSVEDHEASLGDRIGGRGLAWIGGLATLIIGLRRRIPQFRLAGLVLLLVTAAKVFLYDLSTLTSI